MTDGWPETQNPKLLSHVCTMPTKTSLINLGSEFNGLAVKAEPPEGLAATKSWNLATEN